MAPIARGREQDSLEKLILLANDIDARIVSRRDNFIVDAVGHPEGRHP